MFILNWWNSLDLAAQIFYCIAIPASVVLLIQTVLTFIGIGDDADSADGISDDASDVADTDSIDGVFGESSSAEAANATGLGDLRVLTFRGVVAFFVVFGWVGVLMHSLGVKLYFTLPAAFASGVAIMFILAIIFNKLMKLRNNGNIDNKNAIGASGKVYLSIPPSRSGEGKVQLMIQGAFVERNAVTDDAETIPTGSEIVVVGVSGQTDLIVKRK